MKGRIRSASLVLVTAASLAGCADIGFKRGGSAGDFAAAQHRCQAAGDTGYQGCMADAGWTTGAIETAPAATPSAAPAPASAPATAPSPTTPSPTTTHAEADLAPPTAAAATAARGASVPWWKFGGGAGELAAAEAACGGKTEPPTPAYLDCMKERGWRRIAFQAAK